MTTQTRTLAQGEIAVSAPAKVNLYLHVTGRRDDGYHLLDSLVVFAGIGDRLLLAPADDFSLSVEGPNAEALAGMTVEDNLVLRAARLLAQEAGVQKAAAITLVKNLPVAAGIGGGSADAAAVLRGLAWLWNLSISDQELAALGMRLGADIPVCLLGRPTLLGGVGDDLRPSPELPQCWLVLVNPGVPLSTPAVFRERHGEFSVARPIDDAPKDAAELAEKLRRRKNDLTAAATALAPQIGEVLVALAATKDCLLPRMSGSGATCFGLYATEEAAQNAARALRQSHPHWWIAPAEILPPNPS